MRQNVRRLLFYDPVLGGELEQVVFTSTEGIQSVEVFGREEGVEVSKALDKFDDTSINSLKDCNADAR